MGESIWVWRGLWKCIYSTGLWTQHIYFQRVFRHSVTHGVQSPTASKLPRGLVQRAKRACASLLLILDLGGGGGGSFTDIRTQTVVFLDFLHRGRRGYSKVSDTVSSKFMDFKRVSRVGKPPKTEILFIFVTTLRISLRCGIQKAWVSIYKCIKWHFYFWGLLPPKNGVSKLRSPLSPASNCSLSRN